MGKQSRFERTLTLAPDGWSVDVVDQTLLPHELKLRRLRTAEDAAEAIVSMRVRGSNLIGVTAAHGMALAMKADPSDRNLKATYDLLLKTRPTAVNLRWALDDLQARLSPLPKSERRDAAYLRAGELIEEDVATNRSIGEHGLELFRRLAERKRSGEPLQILTHCNAGRLGTLDWGTATAPIYLGHQEKLPLHVWVSETRPRNQGAALTAWELSQRQIPLTVIADNAAGHLMQRGLIDLVIVGADRVTARGDVANKIGTYLKALAARAHGIPFYVAFVGNSIDWTIEDGIADIPIEQRSAREVTHVPGAAGSKRGEVRVTPEGVTARNDAFDVTPAKFITALITERGSCKPSATALKRLFRS